MTIGRSATLAVLLVTLSGSFGAVGCTGSGSSDVVVEDAAVSASTGDIAAGYATIDNRGEQRDELVRVTCSCAAQVSLHQIEDRNGVAMMVPTQRMELPARSAVLLSPGGSHLMLEELDEPLRVGDRVELTFEFDRGRRETLEVSVATAADLVDRVDIRSEGGAG